MKPSVHTLITGTLAHAGLNLFGRLGGFIAGHDNDDLFGLSQFPAPLGYSGSRYAAVPAISL